MDKEKLLAAYDAAIRDLKIVRDRIERNILGGLLDQQQLDEFNRIGIRISELLHEKTLILAQAGNEAAARLEAMVGEEVALNSRVVEPLARLFGTARALMPALAVEDDDPAEPVRPAAFRAAIPVPKPVVVPPPSGTGAGIGASPAPAPGATFAREALAALAEAEAGKEIVLTADSDARKFVKPFEPHFSTGWDIKWCAAFAHWCCNQVGAKFPVKVPGDGGHTFAYNVAWKNWAERNGLYKRPSEYQPRRGDIAIFEWKTADDPDDITDHVGIVLGVTPQGIRTAEGNTKNSSGQRFSTAIKNRRFASVDGYVVLTDGFVCHA